MLKLLRILKDWCDELYDSFIAASIDFWNNSRHHGSFGLFVINFVAEQYEVFNEMDLFMSRETKEKLDTKVCTTGKFIYNILYLATG